MNSTATTATKTNVKGTTMNTIIDHKVSTGGDAGDNGTAGIGVVPRPSSVRRIVGGVLAALILGLGIGAASNVQPAAAASGMTICFKTRSGMKITGVAAFSEIYAYGQWYPTQAKETNFNGCITFYLNAVERNYAARIRVPPQSSEGDNTIWYTSGWVPAGSWSYNFGNVSPLCGGTCYGY